MEGEEKIRFHRLSTGRFIPEGNEVSRVLIHLPSFTLRGHGSRLVDSSITMTVIFDSECALPLQSFDCDCDDTWLSLSHQLCYCGICPECNYMVSQVLSTRVCMR